MYDRDEFYVLSFKENADEYYQKMKELADDWLDGWKVDDEGIEEMKERFLTYIDYNIVEDDKKAEKICRQAIDDAYNELVTAAKNE